LQIEYRRQNVLVNRQSEIANLQFGVAFQST